MKFTRVMIWLVALPGCYSYATIDPATTQPGASVRARVTTATADQLAPLLGMHTRMLSGTVIASGPDTIIVEVPTSARTHSAGVVLNLRQRVSLPRSGLVELESRTLNRGRTTLAVVGATAAVTTAVVGGFAFGPGRDKRTPVDPGTDFRIPILRASW